MDILENLNDMQKKAVTHKDGSLLILAGAGTGKTRVITRRIAYLIREYGVNPFNILALTFTNKAAGEMKERVDTLLEEGSNVWVSTFHSACVRILRRFIDKIGYERQFNIYDTDDTKTVIKGILKEFNLDTKQFKEKDFLNVISKAKNNFMSAVNFTSKGAFSSGEDIYKRVYLEYEKRMKSNNALDFDDLLLKTVKLFEEDDEVLSYYQRRFKYILVDEYQDTNYVQFRLLKLLANHKNGDVTEHNLCVVGDDDQSIYKFRGANIYNILNFEKEYPDALVIKLEENYRSTGNILNAANGVIKNNTERKGKSLWTSEKNGETISYTNYDTGDSEAYGIANTIKTLADSSTGYSDIAILYRTNAQSRSIEEKLVYSGIPYRIYGGTNFYGRREIKDILAYLKVINNYNDDVCVRRILNVPKRGIGATTEGRIVDYATENGISFFEAARRVYSIPGLQRAATKVEKFVSYIEGKIEEFSSSTSLKDGVETIIEETGYIDELKNDGSDESLSRIDNIYELINKIAAYEKEDRELEDGESLLDNFLSEISLMTDQDEKKEDKETVTLMTLHAAKGLEFKVVFICGLEEGLFPSYMCINSGDESEIEEERRLFYVGITRAREKLYLSNARVRMLMGNEQYNEPSRFIAEIPSNTITSGGFAGGIRTRKIDFSSSEIRSFSENTVNYNKTENRGIFKGNPYITKGFSKNSTTGNQVQGKKSDDVANGDRVSHIKYGKGTVVGISGNNETVEVNFDTGETKKFKLNFAGLKKL